MAMAHHSNAKLLSGATHEDLAKCATRIFSTNETIIAVWRVPESSASNAAWSCIPISLITLPCFWPHLCILSPCLCAGVASISATLKGTTYMLTSKALHVIVDASIGPCGCCFSTGKDSSSMPLNEMGTISVNGAAGGACTCCPFASLNVGTSPGSPVANYGGRKNRPSSTFRMVIDDPEQAAVILQAAKEAHQREMMSEGLQMQQQLLTQLQPGGIVPPPYVGMGAGSGGAAPAAAEDPGAKILQLKGLLDAGAITQVEFDKKKAGYLASM